MKFFRTLEENVPSIPPELFASLRCAKSFLQRIARSRKKPFNSSTNFAIAKKRLSQKQEIKGCPSSPRWEYFLDKIRHDIKQFRTDLDAIEYAQSKIAFDHRKHAVLDLHLLNTYDEYLKSEFPQFAPFITKFCESPVSLSTSLFQKNGRLVSNIFYFHLRYVLQCLKCVPNLKIACEIGGGYGGPARLWIENPISPLDYYIIIDFDESLFFAEVFLKSNLGASKVISIEEFIAGHGAKGSVILCPLSKIDLLLPLSIDLVINTGSMQEMTEEWITYWMEWLDKMDVRYFYSLNYLGQPLEILEEAGNCWSPRLSDKWSTLLRRANPAFVMFHTIRNYGEILAQKGSPNKMFPYEQQFAALKKNILDLQLYMDCLEIIRLAKNPHLTFEFIFFVTENIHYLPKEIYPLARDLMTFSFHKFSHAEQEKLTNLMHKMQAVLQSSRKNVADDVVRELPQKSL